jgi:hypothetical protein
VLVQSVVPYANENSNNPVLEPDGAITLYVFLCMSHIVPHMQDVLDAVMQIHNVKEREKVLRPILVLYEKDMLVKMGFYTEKQKNVIYTNNLLCN